MADFANSDHGVSLCRALYPILERIGLYPALTGGLLYKDGERKDIDILLYRNRQARDGFEVTDSDIKTALESAGVKITSSHGFVTKAIWSGFVVDIFNPETNIIFVDGEYGEEQ